MVDVGEVLLQNSGLALNSLMRIKAVGGSLFSSNFKLLLFVVEFSFLLFMGCSVVPEGSGDSLVSIPMHSAFRILWWVCKVPCLFASGGVGLSWLV